MPNLTADLVINHDLYAKSNVNGYDGTFTTVKKVFSPGLIGNVYSYLERPDGIYWMVYTSTADYNNFNPTYIKHGSNLSLPDAQSILDQITKAQDQKDYETKGAVRYYIDKYAPYIVGAVAIAVALPTIVNATKKK